ncbi:hypothetical protein HDG34_003130 [Paraburkholderia sp. HC6.4b]|uniref:hypothetical protein n=1 Tax=unclassified Paraburkholderia TaxID=2615204 RepID=UPI00160A010B|nr:MULTISPECIES: hypothetical protein [unclassified Paraburkholderia]MBB5409189.1 hypothetical protein [Paraburkholderia sp. HC6.4b]MBB5450917.1 hypothetical protein [Paraburkholderia sp. Kb1A]
MLRKVLNTGPRLSKGAVRLFASLAILLYVTLYWKASAFLPEFVFRDSDKIQSQVGGSSTYQDTSFDAVAKFYSALGGIGSNLLVLSIGIVFIWLMIGYSKRLSSLLVNTVLLAPCVFFNLFVASKDTLVVLMSIVLVLVGRRWNVWCVAIAAIALYASYALTVRIYFALILAIAIGVWVFEAASLRLKTVLVVAVLLGLFILPDAAYVALMHPRDMAMDYLVAGSPYGARTGFYNLFEPASFGAFCVDYLYAVLKLNAPVLFNLGPKEFVMQVFVWIAVGAVFGRKPGHLAGATANASAVDMLACLVIGHMAVSMLFEPDLGSYIRHLASVALFCAWRLTCLGSQSGRSSRSASTRPFPTEFRARSARWIVE